MAAPMMSDMDRNQSFAASFKGSEVSSVQGTPLTDDQKKLLRKARFVMVGLMGVFIACAIVHSARLVFCALQLLTIGALCCRWEEESVLATSEYGVAKRIRNIFCQFLVIIIPLATAGWMLFIMFATSSSTEDE